MIELIVTSPFDGFEKGSHITDPAVIEKVLAENAAHVVKVAGKPAKKEKASK